MNSVSHGANRAVSKCFLHSYYSDSKVENEFYLNLKRRRTLTNIVPKINANIDIAYKYLPDLSINP